MVTRNLPALSAAPTSAVAVLHQQPVIPLAYTHPGLSLPQIVAIVRANWRQGVAIGLIVFLGLAIRAIVKPKAYVATATLQVNYEINDPLGGKEFPINLIGSYIATQMELLSGPVVLTTLVNKFKLYDNKDFAGSLKLGEGIRRAAAEKTLEKNITVEQGKFGSQLIFINYTGTSAIEAADIANGVADIYTSREYQTPALQQSAEAAARYNQQLTELKEKVALAQNALADFHKRTGLITGDGGDVEMSALGNLQASLQEARNRRREAEVLATKNRNVNETLGSAAIQQLRTELRTELAKMDEYRATDGPKHPRVIELQTQIDATRKALAEETRIDTGDSNVQLEAARQLEAKLEKAAEDQRRRVITERQLKEEQEKFKVDLELAQNAYRKALDSYEQISRDSSSKYNGINLISRAVPPPQATGSRTRVGLAIGLAAGLFASFASAFAWGFIDRRVRCRDDLERDYGIPVIVEFKAVPA
ncbi:MAG: hypothetical protein NVS9B10_23050 [Nevskia sp.]